jgi:hypothetical protein
LVKLILLKMEQISESTLLDVFTELKGKAGKNRAFIVYSDFQYAL